MRRAFVIVLLWRAPVWTFAACAAWAAPCQAQPAAAPSTASVASDGGTGWRVECTNDGKRLDCRAINRVSQRDNQQLIASVSVRIPPETKKPVVTVQVPLGIQIGQQVSVHVDDRAPERYPIQTCTPTGCLSGAPVSDALLGALRSGRALKVAFHSLNNQTVTVTMPLAGFALAYDKIK